MNTCTCGEAADQGMVYWELKNLRENSRKQNMKDMNDTCPRRLGGHGSAASSGSTVAVTLSAAGGGVASADQGSPTTRRRHW